MTPFFLSHFYFRDSLFQTNAEYLSETNHKTNAIWVSISTIGAGYKYIIDVLKSNMGATDYTIEKTFQNELTFWIDGLSPGKEYFFAVSFSEITKLYMLDNL